MEELSISKRERNLRFTLQRNGFKLKKRPRNDPPQEGCGGYSILNRHGFFVAGHEIARTHNITLKQAEAFGLFTIITRQETMSDSEAVTAGNCLGYAYGWN